MSAIAKLYDKHLADLRQLADEHKIHFVLMIALHIESHTGKKPYGIRTLGMENKKTEERYIERYRTIFYEQIANVAIQDDASRVDVLAYNMADDIVKQAAKLIEQRQQALGAGRKKGTEGNIAKAAGIKAMARKINDDLLRQPDKARWGLDMRAKYIKSILSTATISIDDKTYPAKRAFGTIKNWITGT